MSIIYTARVIDNKLIGSRDTNSHDIDLINPEKILTSRLSTLVEPLPVSLNECNVLVAKDTWEVQPDFVGYIGFDSAGIQHEITEINVVPDPSWTIDPPFMLADAQAIKKTDIKSLYYMSINEPVTDANSVVWNGGFDSAIKLDAAMRLSEAAGLTSVTFFDLANNEHSLTLAEALVVVITVSSDFQLKLAHKQTLFQLIDNALNQTELDAIVW